MHPKLNYFLVALRVVTLQWITLWWCQCVYLWWWYNKTYIDCWLQEM